MRFIFIILIILATFAFYQNSTRIQNLTDLPEPQHQGPFPLPGNVANVFGWGYNRTSCLLPGTDENIIFYYKEDKNLHFTFTSDMETHAKVNLPTEINPDFDIYCEDKTIYITYSDPKQQTVSISTARIHEDKLDIILSEDIYTGTHEYTAVAPSVRFHNDIPFVAFMAYGLPGSSYPNSIVSVAHKSPEGWIVEEVSAYDASMTQVVGISLEHYGDTLAAFIAPYPGNFYISYLDPEEVSWSDPVLDPVFETRGQLEWQTLTDTSGSLHFIYRNQHGGLSYSVLESSADDWRHDTVADSISTMAFSLFEKDDRVYVLYNDFWLASVDELDHPIQIADAKYENIYFLRTASKTNETTHAVWLEGVDAQHIIRYFPIVVERYTLD